MQTTNAAVAVAPEPPKGPPPQPRSDRAVVRVANTPGADHLDDAIVEKLAALPRRERRKKLAELKRAHDKDVKKAIRLKTGIVDRKGRPLR